MAMLQRYRLGKAALNAMKEHMKQKKSDVQEMQIKSEFLLKARCFRHLKQYGKYRTQYFRLSRLFHAWKQQHKENIEEKIKMTEAHHFRDRLLKQKVTYILYKFTQIKRVPRKHYQRSLLTKAMFTWQRFHKQVKAVGGILKTHLSAEKISEGVKHSISIKFQMWKHYHIYTKTKEKEQKMLLAALQFRINKL